MASGTLNTAFPQNDGEPSKGSNCKKAHLKIRIITLWVGSSPGTHRPSDIFYPHSVTGFTLYALDHKSYSAKQLCHPSGIQRIWVQLFVNFYFRLPFSGCQTENKIGEQQNPKMCSIGSGMVIPYLDTKITNTHYNWHRKATLFILNKSNSDSATFINSSSIKFLKVLHFASKM